MIRLLLVGTMAIVATLGGTYIGALSSRKAAVQSKGSENLEYESFRIDPVSVPILRGGSVKGYVIVSPAITAEVASVKKNKTLITLFVNEATVRAIFEEQAFDFDKLRPSDLAKLTDRITEQANQRLNSPSIKHVVLESINFLRPDEIRAAANR